MDTGKNGTSHDAVTIAAAQTQTAANSTLRVGEAGDCGTATATRQPNHTYTFSLNHKASYLCFLPRTTNAIGTGWVLTSIKVTSDNNIAGNYTLLASGLSGTGTTNTITLSVPNFDITNAETDQDKNAAYMVIAPGTHALTVEYSVKNTITGNTGIIKKRLLQKLMMPIPSILLRHIYLLTILIQSITCGMLNKICGLERQLLIII